MTGFGVQDVRRGQVPRDGRGAGDALDSRRGWHLPIRSRSRVPLIAGSAPARIASVICR